MSKTPHDPLEVVVGRIDERTRSLSVKVDELLPALKEYVDLKTQPMKSDIKALKASVGALEERVDKSDINWAKVAGYTLGALAVAGFAYQLFQLYIAPNL